MISKINILVYYFLLTLLHQTTSLNITTTTKIQNKTSLFYTTPQYNTPTYCSSIATCSENSVCADYQCKCKFGYKYDYWTQSCKQIECRFDSECKNDGICYLLYPSKGYCQCPANSAIDYDSQKCLKKTSSNDNVIKLFAFLIFALVFVIVLCFVKGIKSLSSNRQPPRDDNNRNRLRPPPPPPNQNVSIIIATGERNWTRNSSRASIFNSNDDFGRFSLPQTLNTTTSAPVFTRQISDLPPTYDSLYHEPGKKNDPKLI